MSLVLQIETATTSCSVALAGDGKILAVKQADERGIHAQRITLFIDDVIKAADVKYTDLDAIAVSSGPGSYTGLRIGISTAKGLCFALDKPLIAVETLEAMAYGVIHDPTISIAENSLLCPMIDARRMEVYTAVFDYSGNRVWDTEALIVTDDSFSDLLNDRQVLFFGDGAGKCRGILGEHPNALFLIDYANSAVSLTQQALKRFQNKQFEDMAYFEPYYLKDFIPGNKAV